MPLSEEELRMLEQMERALVEEDPKLASTLRGTSCQSAARRRVTFVTVILLFGIGLLIAAVVLDSPVPGVVMGVAGFVVMLGGAALMATAMRTPATHGPNAAHGSSAVRESSHHGFGVVDGGRRPRAARPHVNGSFMERMEERWRRRRERGF